MKQASLVDDRWPAVLTALPAWLDLDQTARESGALRRRRGVGDAATLLRLALGYGPCGWSLRGVAAWAELSGLASLSDVAIMKRLRAAADWLERIVGAILSARVQGEPAQGEPSRRLVRLVDGTCIMHPGSKGTNWRVHVAYDLAGGRFSHFEVTDGLGAEDLRRAPVAPGEIRIADRFYARAKGLRHIVEGDADFIVRTGWRKLRLSHRDGAPFDLFAVLETIDGDHPRDVPVLVEGDTEHPGLPARLIILRKSAQATEQERRRLRRRASKKGHALDPRTVTAAGYWVLLTSLDRGDVPPERVLALYRLRWQIELAIKRLKSLGHIDRLPAKDPHLARSWLSAHLLVALLVDDLTQEFLGAPPCAGRQRPTLALDLADSEDGARGLARRHPRPSRRPNPARPGRPSRPTPLRPAAETKKANDSNNPTLKLAPMGSRPVAREAAMWRARSKQGDLFEQTTGVTTALSPDLRTKLTPLLQVLLAEAAGAELRQIKGDVLGEEGSDDQDLA